MNKRLKEILKEYEERKHKIIKGDESMNIVVLAGGTSTEREISIVTGTGVCKALRKKGHNAILVDIFCGLEPVDWDEPFGDKDYEVDSAAEYMRSFDDDIEEIKRTRRSFFGPNVLELCQAALGCMRLWDMYSRFLTGIINGISGWVLRYVRRKA